MPKVSVLMPVYNGEQYLAQAIDSVLAQSFTDFELICVDDGSCDASAQIIASYGDKRLRYIKNEVNRGLVFTRNRAIEASQGEYLAWLDCDDLSHPERLQKQVDIFDSDERVGLCGTWVKTFGTEGPAQVWKYPVTQNAIRSHMFFDNPIATSSTMLRRTCLPKHELKFDADFPLAEDYELWERISRVCPLRNIPEILTWYRLHPNQTSQNNQMAVLQTMKRIQRRQLDLLHMSPSSDEEQLHASIGIHWQATPSKRWVNEGDAWLLKLASANEKFSIFPEPDFKRVLARRWHAINIAAVRVGAVSLWRWTQSSLSRWSCQYASQLLSLIKVQVNYSWSLLRSRLIRILRML